MIKASLVTDWLKQPRHWLLMGIIGLAIVLRFNRLGETVIFQADQGRDAIIVKELIRDHDLKLIGPVTSVGNMYLGPFYYYFMAPFLALTYPSPMGPVYVVAAVNVLAVVMVYLLGKDLFDQEVGLIAAFILAIMEKAVYYSRFSWNPNIMPFVALLIVCLAYRAIRKKNLIYFFGAWIAFAIIIQLHYVALLMGFWLLIAYWRYHYNYPKESKKAIFISLVSGLLFVVASFVPLVVFDLSHQHRIWQGFVQFFIGDEQHLRGSGQLMQTLSQFEGRWLHISAKLLHIPQQPQQLYERIWAYSLILWGWWTYRNKQWKRYATTSYWLLFSWLGITVVGTAFYTSSVFDHYVSFVYPAIALGLGLGLRLLISYGSVGKLLAAILLIGISILNIQATPSFGQNGPPLAQFASAPKEVLPLIEGKRYNVLLISDSLDHKGLNYRYFFETSLHPPQGQDDFDSLDRLVVIDDKLSGKPFNHGIYELEKVNFRTIEYEFRIPNGPLIYILKP